MLGQMNKWTARLMASAVFVACTSGLIAWKVAWGTAGVGISTTIISGPVVLDSIRVKSESDMNEVEIATNGFSDVYVVYNKIAPGGHTGWHSHLGPSIISVKSGTATEYHSDDPLVARVHPAGTAFVDEGGDHAHIVVNEGATDLELVAFQILPLGATRRIDKPAP